MTKYLIILFLLVRTATHAQDIRTTPLFTYLQNNFDSTIAYNAHSSWTVLPNLKIITKRSNNINFYTFLPVLNDSGLYYRPDTNKYLKKITPEDTINVWEKLLQTKIWNTEHYIIRSLKSTDKDGNIINHIISDGDEHDFYFITKDIVRKLYYYAPIFYNQHMPDEKLDNGIKSINIFLKIFKD